MILKDKTIEEFGYDPEALTKGSKKKIFVSCDYCQKEYTVQNKNRVNGNKLVDKDGCMGCRQKKKEDVMIAKHGVKNTMHIPGTKEKIKKTNRERYGVDYVTQSKEMQDKSKETCLEKYGVDQIMKSADHQEKCSQAIKDKYGVDNVSQNVHIQAKVRKTNLKNYGVEYITQTDKCKEGMLKKHGVENPFQLESVKEKIKTTNIANYGVDHPMKVPEIQKKAHTKGIQTKIADGQITLYKGETAAYWRNQAGFSSSHFYKLIKDFGWEKAVSMTPYMSSLEVKMEELLKKNDIKYKRQTRIGRYYADFTIGKISIECDGLYFHSDQHKEDNYHVLKREKYIEEGYTPLFFREDEINNKPEIIESIILNKLRKSKRIFARKCEVVKIDKKEAKDFFNENHLMGSGRGETFALKIDGVIYAAFQTVKRKGNTIYEVSRFCNKLNHTVIGGYSRLLRSFEKDTPSLNTLFSFTDLRYGSGDHMDSLGFTKGKSHKSFKWTDGFRKWNRMKFPKSEGIELGLFRIYDCGQLKHEKSY